MRGVVCRVGSGSSGSEGGGNEVDLADVVLEGKGPGAIESETQRWGYESEDTGAR